MQVGVIGVGRMESAMARNLIKAGHKLRVFDTSSASVQALVKEARRSQRARETLFKAMR